MRFIAPRILAASASIAVLLIASNAIRSIAEQPSEPRILDAKDPITYYIGEGRVQAGYRAGDRELALWALQAWQRSAAKTLRFEAAPESSALIRLYWIEPDEGLYGEMLPLKVSGRRGAAVFIQPNVELMGPEIAPMAGADPLLRDTIVYLTCLHELGHALGLAHTQDFRGIMYFFGYGGDIVEYFHRYRAQLRSRNDIASISGLSDADVNRIRKIYSEKR